VYRGGVQSKHPAPLKSIKESEPCRVPFRSTNEGSTKVSRANNPKIWAAMLMMAMSATVVVSLVSGSSPANAGAFPGANGKIAFTRFPIGGTEQIFTMNPDGSNQKNISHTTTFEAFPNYSANGKQITYLSTMTGDQEIFKMDATGRLQTRLTINPKSSDLEPSWSPSGNKIAFRSRRKGNDEIFVMNSDGTGVKRLTINPDVDTSPAWSPNGKKIAFTRFSGGDDSEIFVMNPDGTNQRQLTDNLNVDADPNWSPSGNKIAFTSTRVTPSNPTGDTEIFIMNPDGTNPQNLTQDDTGEAEPAWSPDGKKIAFDGDNADIFVMNALPGAMQKDLTNNPAQEYEPTWQPLR
jgi:Tol biopolymer transport system component